MTLITAVRFDKCSVITSDIRVSLKDRRADAYIKFLPYPPHMGLFLAGSVDLWRLADAVLCTIVDEIESNNIHDPEGPFRSELNSLAMRSVVATSAGAIGFILDPVTASHELFEVALDPGMGCRMSQILPFTGRAIGSGGILEVKRVLQRIAGRSGKRDPACLFRTACGVRSSLQQALGGKGSHSFHTLGVSPFMTLSIIEHGHFRMIGEESEGEHFDFQANTMTAYHYSLEKDEMGAVVLADRVSGQRRRLLHPTTDDVLDWSTFDPQGLE